MNLRQRAFAVLAGAALAHCAARGQSADFETFNPLSSKTGGVHLLGASVSTSYFSNAYGLGLTGLLPSGDSNVVIAQGSLLIGWSRQRQKSNINITYAPSYVHGIQLSNYSSFNQAFSFGADKTLNGKWSINTSVQALLSDFTQLLFSPTRYGSLSTAPSTFDDFSAAILTGRSDNTSLQQMVGAASAISSPETAAVYGNRLLSAAAAVSVSYAQSTRSTYHVSAVASRAQYYTGGSSAPETRPGYLIPKTTTGGVLLSWSYSLTPRTTLSLDASSTRTVSQYQDGYLSQSNVSMGRTMSRRWFLQGTVGVGFITPVRQTFSTPHGAQEQYGGSIGYKLDAHTLLASYQRTASDIYGYGANAMETSTGAWTWKRPGRTISLSGSFGYIRLLGSAFPNQGSWTAHILAVKALNAHLALSGGYSYIQFPQTVLISTPNLTQHGVIVTLSWSPSERQ